MAQLIAWIGLCVVACFVLRHRCIVLILAAIVLWAAVPGVASAMITGQARGSSLAFHPSTWLILVMLATQVLTDLDLFLAELARRILLYLTLLLFLSVAFLATMTSASGGGLVLFLSQMVGPIALFMIINVELHRNPGNLFRLRNWIVGIAAVESALAIVEWVQGGVLLYRTYYELNYWFDEINFPRWMGTLDHPLTLSLLLCAAVPLLAGIRQAWLQLPLLLLMCGGVLATQSRTGLLVVVLAVVYVLVSSKINTLAKVLSIVVVTVAGIYAASSALSAGVADRLANDSGSSIARGDAIDFFFANIGSYMFTGSGIGTAREVADIGGLSTSLESSILIYSVDIGVVFVALYFGAQLVIVLRSFGRSSVPGLALAGLALLIVPQTYNALGSQTLAGPLLWTVLAMAAFMTSQRARSDLETVSRNLDVQRERNLQHWVSEHPRPAPGGPATQPAGSPGRPPSP